jgi:uncharacterized protein (DUF2062 family)
MVKRALRRWLPSPHTVRTHRALRWLGPVLHQPWLWHLGGHEVAVGAACGIFFGFLVPVGQIPLAALLTYALRGNLAIAVVTTFVSNPFTYVPIYVLAYRLGASLLGVAVERDLITRLSADPMALIDALGQMGPPLALGLALFAVVGASLAYVTIQSVWQSAQLWRARRVKRRAAARRGRRLRANH